MLVDLSSTCVAVTGLHGSKKFLVVPGEERWLWGFVAGRRGQRRPDFLNSDQADEARVPA